MADGQNEGTENNGATGSENQNDGENQNNNGAENEGTENSGQQNNENDSGSEKPAAVTREEFEKLMNRMKAADRRAAAAEAKVAEHEKEKLSDVERAKAEALEMKQKAEAANAAMRELRIRNAFLANSEVTWHDPDDALRLADLSGVEISDDGEVDKKAVSDALKALAKAKPHLVKTQTATEASGSANNGSRKGNQGKPDMNAMKSRFPALNQRM